MMWDKGDMFIDDAGYHYLITSHMGEFGENGYTKVTGFTCRRIEVNPNNLQSIVKISTLYKFSKVSEEEKMKILLEYQ